MNEPRPGDPDAWAVDHAPAWALIPWYGDDGLGAPTLDDWRVWADWLMAHDPDDERDARIAATLSRSDSAALVGWTCMRAWASTGSQTLLASPVWPIYGFKREFLGFEVQPTRREMRHPRNYEALAQAVRAGRVGFPSIVDERDMVGAGIRCGKTGHLIDALAAVAQVSDAARIVGEATSLFAGTRAAADAFSRTLHHVNATTQGAPRNPRRRGDTGAHGRARR